MDLRFAILYKNNRPHPSSRALHSVRFNASNLNQNPTLTPKTSQAINTNPTHLSNMKLTLLALVSALGAASALPAAASTATFVSPHPLASP
jgi:hypothetical protein